MSAAEKFLPTDHLPRGPQRSAEAAAPGESAGPGGLRPRRARGSPGYLPRDAVHLRSAAAAARAALPGSGAGPLPCPARPSEHAPALGRTAVAQPPVSVPAPGKLPRTSSRGDDDDDEPWEQGLAQRPRC